MVNRRYNSNKRNQKKPTSDDLKKIQEAGISTRGKSKFLNSDYLCQQTKSKYLPHDQDFCKYDICNTFQQCKRFVKIFERRING